MRANGYSMATLRSLKEEDVRIKRLISRFINTNRKLDIADMGTGAGLAAISFALDGHNVIGIDISEIMLEKARANAIAMGVDVEFILGDSEEPPLKKGSFDLVIAHNTVWNLKNPEKAYYAWKELLRPGGVIAVIDGNYYLHLFNPEYKKRYDHRNAIKHGPNDGLHGKTNVDHVDFTIIEDLAKDLPLSREVRPAWDVSAFARIGMTDIHIKMLDDEPYSFLGRNGMVELQMRFIICARVPYDDISRFDAAMADPILRDEDIHYLMQRAEQQDVSQVTVLKALSDEKRLRIVDILKSGKMSVAQIATLIDMSPSLTSHNLKILRDAGIVSAEKQGKEMLYSLTRAYHLTVLLEMCSTFKNSD